jgi:peroxiredoxin (alkyl hydroperoxide reductase subunit C)
MSLVGKKFPSIAVDAISEMGDNLKINIFEEALNNNKKVVLFWYPKDFTFVCPTELHAFQAALPEFEKRNTIVIGASCDTNEVHFAWLNTAKDNGGIEGVTYPLLADTNRNLSNILGILDVESTNYSDETDSIMIEGSNVTYRATYLIDETGKIFHESVNDMPLGRNVNEFTISGRLHTRASKRRSLSCQLGRRKRSNDCRPFEYSRLFDLSKLK